VSQSRRQWIVFALDRQSFAIPSGCIREMNVLSAVHRLPLAPLHARGMMLVHGHAINTFDLRLLLGMHSYQEDHRKLLRDFMQRKQDHINWLNELEGSLQENRPFGLTLDPHRCAFGRWYDQYRTDDAVLSLKLMQFDQPHQRIHMLGAEVRRLGEQGRRQAALAMIEGARDKDLSALLRLFDEVLPMLGAQAREVLIVVSNGTREIGLIVDDVCEMREFDLKQMQELPADSLLRSQSEWVRGFGVNGDRVTVFLDCDKLLERLAA
jgi:chemotaxis signal transduction protein